MKYVKNNNFCLLRHTCNYIIIIIIISLNFLLHFKIKYCKIINYKMHFVSPLSYQFHRHHCFQSDYYQSHCYAKQSLRYYQQLKVQVFLLKHFQLYYTCFLSNKGTSQSSQYQVCPRNPDIHLFCITGHH